MPVAINFSLAPTVTVGLTIVTAMEDRVALDPVRTVFPETPPAAAVMVVLPAPLTVARPVVLFTDATDPLEELQVTCAVIT